MAICDHAYECVPHTFRRRTELLERNHVPVERTAEVANVVGHDRNPHLCRDPPDRELGRKDVLTTALRDLTVVESLRPGTAADAVPGLEHSDLMSRFAQLPGSCEAGQAGANHDYVHCRFFLLSLDAVGQACVGTPACVMDG